MQNSLFFKNVINSDSIFESIGQLNDIAKKSIGCEHISLFLMDDKYQLTPAAYSVNISTAVMEHLKYIVLQTQFFSLSPDGMRLSMDEASGTMKEHLLQSRYACIYGFHIKHGSSYGALLFSFPSNTMLKDEQLHLCNLIRLHMEQLIKKIQFRKQVLKQQAYESLFNTLRVKDSFTVDHCYNVAFYSTLLGAKAGVSEVELETLKLGALLHDIGKLAIPDHILMKPGRLSDDEFRVIRQHPVIGHELLKELPEVEHLLPMVRWHHERMDGRGYPDQLVGEDIPYLVRIVCIADAFDAMTSTRVYRNSLHVHEVREQLLIHAGKQFDEDLVRIFLSIIDEQMQMND
ncbi:HD-GYP domain-containing protein [Paenibacillus sp. GCM10023248]|uniref:HD-GYP domain-containing protein n=1 Tax=Bacillales TaxID=1385 RepID=UPI0023793E31|nr:MULTISPECIES: HD-GYP domain-containing protein [Bacillales]MDD9272153.1 HD-GYP domain-containing protein [Paenibacillus sp. MAHUQ-63]MDR6885322.1 putative nucleotidyltransferase with HDIG domain [Bacillus sp. 3255]